MSGRNVTHTISVDLLGPTGVGKTIVLATLLKYLREKQLEYDIRDYHDSGSIGEALRELEAGRFPRQTPPIVTEPGKDSTAFHETFGFTWTDPKTGESYRFRFTAHAGDKISLDRSAGGGADVRQVVADYEADPNRVLVAVVNPFVCDEERAGDAFVQLIAWLQRQSIWPKRENWSFLEAVEVAATALFGHKPADVELADGSARVRAQAAGEPEGSWRKPAYFSHEKSRLYFESHRADVVLKLNTNSAAEEQIEVTPTSPKEGAAERDESLPLMGLEVVQELHRIAKAIVSEKSSRLPVIRELLQRVERVVLVPTHQDLFLYLHRFELADFSRILNGLFGTRERFMSQQVIYRSIETEFVCPTPKRVAGVPGPVPAKAGQATPENPLDSARIVTKVLTDQGMELFNSLVLQTVKGHVSPVRPSGARPAAAPEPDQEPEPVPEPAPEPVPIPAHPSCVVPVLALLVLIPLSVAGWWLARQGSPWAMAPGVAMLFLVMLYFLWWLAARPRPLDTQTFALGIVACLAVVGVSSLVTDATPWARRSGVDQTPSKELLATNDLKGHLDERIEKLVGKQQDMSDAMSPLLPNSPWTTDAVREIQTHLSEFDRPVLTVEHLFDSPRLSGVLLWQRKLELIRKWSSLDSLWHDYHVTMLQEDYYQRKLDGELGRKFALLEAPPEARAAEAKIIKVAIQGMRDFADKVKTRPDVGHAVMKILHKTGPLTAGRSGDVSYLKNVYDEDFFTRPNQRLDGLKLVSDAEFAAMKDDLLDNRAKAIVDAYRGLAGSYNKEQDLIILMRETLGSLYDTAHQIDRATDRGPASPPQPEGTSERDDPEQESRKLKLEQEELRSKLEKEELRTLRIKTK